MSVMMKQITQNCFLVGHKLLKSIYFHVVCTDVYHYNTFIAVSEVLFLHSGCLNFYFIQWVMKSINVAI